MLDSFRRRRGRGETRLLSVSTHSSVRRVRVARVAGAKGEAEVPWCKSKMRDSSKTVQTVHVTSIRHQSSYLQVQHSLFRIVIIT